MRELLPFERQMLLAEVYHYAWYNPEAYTDLLKFIKKYETLGKPVFLTQPNNNDTTTTHLEPLTFGQDINTNPGFDKIQ